MTATLPGRRSGRIATRCLPVLLAGALLTACDDGDTDAATRSLEAFLTSWRGGVVPGHEAEYRELTSGLGARAPELNPAGEVDVDGDRATAPVTVAWTLAPTVRWEYQTTVTLARAGDDWRVEWSPTTVQPDLAPGDRLALRRDDDSRAAILDGGGKPITEPRPVVVVGVQPGKVESAERLAADLGAALAADGVDTTGLPDRIGEAGPDVFLSVVTLRKERYLEVRDAIHDLPGTVFREETRVLAPSRDFARALLGTVDPVTREDIDAAPGVFAVGDEKGHNGLQGRYDERLRGAPAVTVTAEGSGRELFRAERRPGAPVRTTLDQKVQNAADGAVAEGEKKASIVAVRISDSAVLAVANSPSAGAQNLAMDAHVPPGSTFKVVSGLSLLESGAVDLDTPVPCPATVNVEGRVFKNAWNGGLDNATFRDAVAHSCNTAFALLAPKLGPDGLARTAGTLGIDQRWDLGIDVHTGSVATDGGAVEQAAAAFGQGRTVVSPMAMAAATAGVARGTWRQPALVTDPAPAAPAADGPELDQAAVRALHTAMREVVTRGSARPLNGAPGGPLHGKTGTAEYGTETPPRSHSWFVGWQGDVAFAVFVEDGGNDVSLALAAARRFLDRLHR
ncbi:Cell division protein FtsI/penicillin-binding protein 2 [Amycolatopsis arida]|uniref:Cell division protein FtsI/penicillin-binding protein 2 n=1 Tax=Amycolatopsis arida TaxID=587909 RepID=A0A1I5XQ17_9PSEU|nr:penicillin-binding transpeptidase domain-containing protein [Amycolatopsis arida]TDX97323.1 cell division protein FtsI/penicillin-binding protein 2 [Amycolatopsis arida]SFQ34024.1 Cell division protein FtsI/penicillin-binding protein 2 [Amycolatopsis arida]